jgi:hypothetical protein
MLAVCLAAFCCTPLHAEALLRWKFAEGQKLLVSVEQKTELETTAGTKPRKVLLEMLMDLQWLVEGVDAQGTADIRQTIVRLKSRMETGGAPAVEFDTASAEQPKGAAEYFAGARQLVGAQIQLKLTARGEIQAVTVSEETTKLIGEALAGTALAPLFSSAGLADTLKQSAAVLPEQALNEGNAWQIVSSAKLPAGAVQQRTTYTYRGVRDVDGQMLEAIELSSLLELGKPPADAKHPLTIKEQSHTGTLLFDAAAGRFVRSEVNQRLVTESPYRGTQVRVAAKTTLTTTYRPAE